MRIGLVANSIWNILNFRTNLLESLRKASYEVVVIAPPHTLHERRLQDLGFAFFPVNLQNKGTNPLKDLAFAYALYKIYRKQKIDIALHFTIKPNIYGAFACYMAGVSCINNVTGLGTVFLHRNIKTKIAKLLYRLSFRIPQHIFFQNKDDKALFYAQKLITENTSVGLLAGSGIDLVHFKPLQNPLPHAQNHPFTFLMIARLLYDKGVVEYAEAARQTAEKLKTEQQQKSVKFCLLGALETDAGLGVSAEKLREWTEAGVLEYLGTTTDVRAFIAQAHCVVLPSYREGTPRALLEAASMGKPLIATDVAGCREVVNHAHNGFLCTVKSAESLSGAMLKMCKSSDENLLKMGKKSRELAENKFDQSFISEAYHKKIKQLADTKQENL